MATPKRNLCLQRGLVSTILDSTSVAPHATLSVDQPTSGPCSGSTAQGRTGDVETKTECQIVAEMKLCKTGTCCQDHMVRTGSGNIGSERISRRRKPSTSTLKERLTENESAGQDSKVSRNDRRRPRAHCQDRARSPSSAGRNAKKGASFLPSRLLRGWRTRLDCYCTGSMFVQYLFSFICKFIVRSNGHLKICM